MAIATINASQAYDVIHTLTFNNASGSVPIGLRRGGTSRQPGLTFYWREGTSGTWITATSTSSYLISRTTSVIQVAHNHDKSGNNYITVDFTGTSNVIKIQISQKAKYSGIIGSSFMYDYAQGCTSLTSLDVPDTSNVTSVEYNFMSYYAQNCTSLTSLDVPDTSNVTSVGDNFMVSYAYACTSLTSLSIPDLSKLILASLPSNFMINYARNASKLEILNLPGNSNIYKDFNINWNIQSDRLGILKAETANKQDWEPLVVLGKTLYTNQIRDINNIIQAQISNSKIYNQGDWKEITGLKRWTDNEWKTETYKVWANNQWNQVKF